ncbi:spore germination protein [Cytobacillus sp. Hz8]|uniref:spore germination protein n=1 Tax=Cytobacillus sp. Hz8 TaxID=3347168 RepID=UPI0035DA9622
MSKFRMYRKHSRLLSKENKLIDQAKAKQQLSGSLETDLQIMRETFSKSSDVVIRKFQIGKELSIPASILFTDGLADTKMIQQVILESLMYEGKGNENIDAPMRGVLTWMKNKVLNIGDVKEIYDLEELFVSILSGNTVIIIDGFPAALSASTYGFEGRSVTEPTTQNVVRGPMEAFTESIRINTALVRRKIKDPNLHCEQKQIGKITKTDVSIMYIKGIVTDDVVEEVRTRIERIDIDGILESSYIEELIQDETFTPFPTVFNTERPDVVAAGLLEGRVAIIVDGTPFVLIVPSLFIHNFQVAEDYYQRADISSLLRILRIICFLISLLGPSFYIALTTFHQEMVPTPLLINLASQREGVPFPAFVEALIMEVTFEILREAGIRMPTAVGQTVSIVGALVLGQAAVEAGIVSAAMVIVVSITAIANFCFPAYNMAISVRMLRFIMMMLAASFGLYGVTLGILALLLHLNSIRSFGMPYMAPFSPFILADQKDAILRFPRWGLFSRPRLMNQKNKKRKADPKVAKPESNK